MYTRKNCLDKLCSHRVYYAQFVDNRVLSLVAFWFDLELLQSEYAKDSNFNTIQLDSWNKIQLGSRVHDKLVQAEDYMTKAGRVCILKEAAAQLVELSYSEVLKPIHKEAI